MIKRLSKHNDYKDIIKSCPSGVIDDIYAIEYYIQGYNTVIQANFTKTGDVLEVILPSSDLNTLPNGVLMRRAYYKVIDASYPDGYYNLQFEDNMSVWLGEVESEEPVIPEYVTEEELAETLEDYVTSDTLDGTVGAINAHFTAVEGELSSVSQTANNASGAADAAYQTATQAEQGVLQALDVAAQAQQTAAGATTAAQQAQQTAAGAVDAALSAQDSVQQLSSDLSDMDIIVRDLSGSTSDLDQRLTGLENADFQGQIDGLDHRVYDLEQGGVGGGTWGSITGDINDQQDLMYEFDKDRGRLNDLEDGTVVPTGTATESWVQQQGYITSSSLNGYATETWVQNQGYLTQHQDLTGYATQTWVQNQGYLDSNSTLPADQITCNISGDVFDFDDVDEGLTALVSKVEENIGDISSLDTRVTALEQSGGGGGGTWGSITGTISDQTDLMNLFSGYATESWVQSQGYLTSHQDLSSYATKSWVSSQQFATESWVSSQGYLTSHQDLTGYATESWVQSQGYLTSHQDLTGYATQSWVSSQGYLTSHQDLSSYATQSWATSTFFEESKIWVGTLTQWNALTSAQKSAYTIAMIRE